MQSHVEVPLPHVAAETPAEDVNALASVPWLAVAAAAHTILLVIAWFVMPHEAQSPPTTVLGASINTMTPPPVPVQPPDRVNDFLAADTVVDKPVEDPRITPDAKDDFSSDPTDQPWQELAEAETNDPNPYPSPAPDKSTNSSIGLGPGLSGGKPGGERGGMIHARSRGPGGGKPPVPPENPKAAHLWLADHQNREGYWSATTFNEDSTRTGARRTYNRELVRTRDPQGDKGWDSTVDVGLTGLSLLAFTGALHTHKEGDYKQTVRGGIGWLRGVQDNDGCFGAKSDDHHVYNHAIATMAMAELYLIAEDRVLKPIVERGVQFILRAQNPGAGWRYGVKPGFSDSSVTGWMVLTLHTAHVAGIEFDSTTCYDDAAKWFKGVTSDVNGYPRTGYVEPGGNGSRLRSAQNYENVPSMDAINIMSMLFMHKADLSDPTIRAQAGVISQNPPEWKHEKLDFYYWYYASLALFQAGGSAWERWQKPLAKTLLDSQRGYGVEKGETPQTLDEHGSWDPIDAWGAAGGRVYSTAINCLTLQVWYRYEKLKK